MRITVRWVTLMTLLVAAAPAGAEPIVALGAADGPPSAVTDQNGSLHAVWKVRQPDGRKVVGTCSVPAGGTACTFGAIGGFPNLLDDPIILQRADGVLVIVISGSDESSNDVTFALTSGDGGATWSAPAIVGRGQYDVREAALTPDGQAIDTVGFVPGLTWQRVPVAGAAETRVVDLQPEPGGAATSYRFGPSLAYLADGRAMVVATSAQARVGLRILQAGADPYVNASWTPWGAAPRAAGIDAVAASGPNGVWALLHRSVGAGQGQPLLRFDGRRFARPRSLGTIGGPALSNDLGQRIIGSARDFTEDAGGRLHAAWSRYGGCGAGRQCIYYRRNEPRSFGPVVAYPFPTGAPAPSSMQLAPNAGGSGWMVWRGGVGDGAPNFATPLATPPRGSRVGSKRVARGPRVTLPTRYGCVAPGGKYRARLLVRGRPRGVRITAVRFSFDGGRAPSATDRRAPFAHTFALPFAAGERHVSEARVTYRKGGRTGHTQVGRAIVMCP